MKHKKVLVYSLCLAVGTGLALLAAPRFPESRAQVHHGGPEVVLPEDLAVHRVVAALSEKLEARSATVQDVLEATALLLDAVRLEMQASEEEGIRLPLVDQERQFGYLQMLQATPERGGQWTLKVTIPAPRRYGDVAEFSELSITYVGADQALTSLNAITHTPVHKRSRTIAALGSNPLIIGGVLSANNEASYRQSITMTVDVPEDTQVPVWTTAMGDLEQGEDSLGNTDTAPVAAILFTL